MSGSFSFLVRVCVHVRAVPPGACVSNLGISDRGRGLIAHTPISDSRSICSRRLADSLSYGRVRRRCGGRERIHRTWEPIGGQQRVYGLALLRRARSLLHGCGSGVGRSARNFVGWRRGLRTARIPVRCGAAQHIDMREHLSITTVQHACTHAELWPKTMQIISGTCNGT